MFWNAFRVDLAFNSTSDALLNFLPQTALALVVLFAVCFWKGESPKWMWGLPKKDSQDKTEEK